MFLVPTCSDGVQNQNETGIDCGGSNCSKCGLGQGCNVDDDCISYQCKLNMCQGKFLGNVCFICTLRPRKFL